MMHWIWRETQAYGGWPCCLLLACVHGVAWHMVVPGPPVSATRRWTLCSLAFLLLLGLFLHPTEGGVRGGDRLARRCGIGRVFLAAAR